MVTINEKDHYYHGVVATIIASVIFLYNWENLYYYPYAIGGVLIVALIVLGHVLNND